MSRPAAGAGGGIAHRLRRAWGAPRSPQAIVVVLAAWLAVVGNLQIWRSLHGLVPGAAGVVIGIGVALLLCSTTALLLAPTAWGRWMKPVWLLVVAAAALSQHYMLDFGVVIDPTMLASVVQTNVAEARDLLGWALVGNVLLVMALPALWLWQVPVAQAAWQRTVLRTLLLAAAAAAASLALALALYSVLAPLVRNHLELRYLPNPLSPLISAAKVTLRPMLAARRPLVRISAGAALGPSHAAAGAKPPLIVIALGETARADHFGLDGYARDTTPELAARTNLVSYRNAWSCGTSTLASLPCMFSSLGQAAFNRQDDERENVLDVAQAAGLAVLWIDNQAGCKHVCDRVASASTQDLGNNAEARILCDRSECLDEALLVGIDARIERLPAAQRRNGVLVVLHMMGSHGPAYFKRSPPERKPFKPECLTTTLGDCETGQLVNAYDNSIAYTDHVLSRTIEWLKGKSASHAAGLFYVSDHGESLGEYGIYLHGIPYAFAPDSQKHVPLVLWLSSELAARDGVETACLAGHRDERTSHDNLFHSILGLVDVTSPTYLANLDLVAPCRKGGASR